MVPVVTTFPSFDYVSSHLVHNNESSSGYLLEFYHYHYHYHYYQNIDDGYDPDTVAVDAVAVAPSSAPASSSSSTIVKNSDDGPSYPSSLSSSSSSSSSSSLRLVPMRQHKMEYWYRL